MAQTVKINGEVLAKNTALSFLGLFLPLLVGLFTLPVVIRGLGTERFGVFSLIWVVFGYFSLFDFGLGRASTKFVAEALGTGETERIPSVVWTSLFFVSLLGLLGGAIFVGITPLLIEHVLKVPHYLIEEAKLTYYISSALIPIILVTSTLNGVLEAYQRFDLTNMLKVPSNILSAVIPVVVLLFHGSLPFIVFILVIKNLFIVLISFFLAFRLTGRDIGFSLRNSQIVRSLLKYGGWISAISLTSSFITYVDRFLIGSILSMAAVAYYTPPYEVVSKLWIIPLSMYMTLFPAFSVLWTNRREEVEIISIRANKYIILSTGPIVLILVIFAKDILNLWVGSEFAAQGTWAFQILAIGFFLNCQAWIPSTLLQGIDRPDLVAKIFLLELPLYVGTAWWLIGKMGINGAALAWALRGAFETISFLVVSWRVTSFRPSTLLSGGVLRGLAALGILILMASALGMMLHEMVAVRAIITAGLIVLFLLYTYFYALNGPERAALKVGVLQITGIK